jgi:nitrogen fixation protein NifU and related proteins
MTNMYSAEVLEHFQNPRGVGELESATVTVDSNNPVCGDVLRLSIQVEAGRIVQARFRAKGCVPAIACGSKLVEILQDRSVDEARHIRPQELIQALGGLPAASSHAAELASSALLECLRKLPEVPSKEAR